jgi:hypothetical protein
VSERGALRENLYVQVVELISILLVHGQEERERERALQVESEVAGP